MIAALTVMHNLTVRQELASVSRSPEQAGDSSTRAVRRSTAATRVRAAAHRAESLLQHQQCGKIRRCEYPHLLGARARVSFLLAESLKRNAVFDLTYPQEQCDEASPIQRNLFYIISNVT